MFRGCQSIANVSAAIARELIGTFNGVGLYSHNGLPFFSEDLESHARLDENAPIGMYYGMPEARRLPIAFHKHSIRIGGFVCETDRIHRDWVDVCNRLDFAFVPSEFCRRAFVDSGVEVPVMVVPHGLEPEFRPYDRPGDRSPFIFFNSFDSGSFHQRKSATELVQCFCRTFSDADGVELHLRTQATKEMLALVSHHDRHGLIRLVPADPLPLAAFAKLYSQVDCVVHPSKGEGFGLIPFQAIACECPVIAPAVTGMADYLNDSNAVILKTGDRIRGVALGNAAGHYYAVDENDLCRSMRYVLENWSRERNKLMEIGPAFRKQHAWPEALAGLVSFLRRLLADGNTTAGKRRVLAPLAPR